jgi:tRNA-2-methylthio-N6-dimethylallyladenosine synthase
MELYSPKKYYIKTYGCQANIADSNTMRGILDVLGFEEFIPADTFKNEDDLLLYVLSNVDIFIINTCSIRQKSEDKVYGLGRILKKVSDISNKQPYVILSGCIVGSATGDRARSQMSSLTKKTPWVGYYMNPNKIWTLPNVLFEAGYIGEDFYKKYDPNSVVQKLDSPKHAYVNISYGCDNFCTYCVVPYARGTEISRSKQDIIKEINHLVSRGVTDITLCGQNVNSWGLDRKTKFEIRTGSDHKTLFADLLKDICAIEGVARLDFLSSNPFDFTSDLIEILRNPKIGNYIHIAVQSGNDEILKKMNRRHSVKEFKDLVNRIHAVRPDMEIGTDIIVGFPGETESQFLDTVQLIEDVKFNVLFASIYSERQGTVAQRLYKDDVPLKEKKRRHAVLSKVWKNTQKK